MTTTEAKLNDALLNAVQIMKSEYRYNPSIFIQMLTSDGAIETCRKLILSKRASDGFAKLWEFHRLDLSVEAIVLRPEFNGIFSSEEKKIARRRLKEYDYTVVFLEEPATDQNQVFSISTWTLDDIQASVTFYIQQLNLEKPKSLSAPIDTQNKLALNANAEFFEDKMRIISSVFDRLCLPTNSRFRPNDKIDDEMFDKIQMALVELGSIRQDDFTPSSDISEYNTRANNLLKIVDNGNPIGSRNPARSEKTISSFSRDPLIKAWIIKSTKGICENCSAPPAFFTDSDEPYLEVHHVKLLSDGGADTTDNAVGLCPKCHREIHYGKQRSQIISELYNKIPRLIHSNHD